MSPTKNILVCLEGSASCNKAVSVAITLAKEFDAKLVGLAIVDEQGITAGSATGIGGTSFKHSRDERLLADAHNHAQAWLAAFESRAQAAGVGHELLESRGRPSAEILLQMKNHDLTVVGRHANFHFETRDTDKETLVTVLHRAGKPVLLVPEDAAPSLGPGVMIAYDGSSAANRAVESFARSGLSHNRKVHVMSIDEDGATAWGIAQRAAAMLKAHGIPCDVHNVVTLKTIAEAITGLCTAYNAGCLVMGAYTPSRLKELLWGSTTREVIEQASIPMFLHH